MNTPRLGKLRGWTSASKQPEKYARLTTDEYLQKKAGLEVKGRDNPDKLVKCMRCKEINHRDGRYDEEGGCGSWKTHAGQRIRRDVR